MDYIYNLYSDAFNKTEKMKEDITMNIEQLKNKFIAKDTDNGYEIIKIIKVNKINISFGDDNQSNIEVVMKTINITSDMLEITEPYDSYLDISYLQHSVILTQEQLNELITNNIYKI